jgi:hypothetical protein
MIRKSSVRAGFENHSNSMEGLGEGKRPMSRVEPYRLSLHAWHSREHSAESHGKSDSKQRKHEYYDDKNYPC